MSTPRAIRRHSPASYNESVLTERVTTWKAGIFNTDVSELFAQIVSGFEHIEANMEIFLAHLLGSFELSLAQCIYRTLRNPCTRLEVVRNLLEKSHTNAKLGREHDDFISSYDGVRIKRNDFAHELWWTDNEFRTFLAKPGFNEYPILSARRIELPELQTAIEKQVKFRDDLKLAIIEPIRRRQARSRRRRKPKPQ